MRTRTIEDGVPVEYVTTRDHEGIPKGTKVVALRDGGKLVHIHDGQRFALEDKFYLAGYEDAVPEDAFFWLAM